MAGVVGRYVPPQHGAWAFLGLPVLLAATLVGLSGPVVILSLAWVVAYPWSYAALGLARSSRPQRFRQPFVVLSAVLVPLVVAALLVRPWLIWAGAVLAALFTVNLRYASANDERALANDAVFVIECSAMVPITWAVAVGDQTWPLPLVGPVPSSVWVLTIVCTMVLLGSTLHVKSLIRERRDRRYSRASRVLAVTAVPVSMLLATWWGLPSGLWLVAAFVVLAGRAFVVGDRPMRPGRIGMIELSGFVVVVVAAAFASG